MKSAIFITLMLTIGYNNYAQNVGIGTNNPGAKLDVNGQIKIQGGQPGMNKVLTSDANGLATWEGSLSCYDQTEATVPANNTDVTVITSSTSNWKGEKLIIIAGHCVAKASIPPQIPLDNLSANVNIKLEVWVEYNHPTYGNIKFKSEYFNMLTTDGRFTLPLNCLMPSISGVPFTVGVQNNSTFAYFDSNSSTIITAPLPMKVNVEIQGIEL